MLRFPERWLPLLCCLAMSSAGIVGSASASRPGAVGVSIVRYFDLTGSETLWMAGEDGLYKSTDGGASWTCLNPALAGAGFEAAGPSRFEIRHALFVSDRLGWVLSAAGQVFATRDGGLGWHPGALAWFQFEPPEAAPELLEIHARGDSEPWILGALRNGPGRKLQRPFLCRGYPHSTDWNCRHLPGNLVGPFSFAIADGGGFWVVAFEESGQTSLGRGDPGNWTWSRVAEVPAPYSYRLRWAPNGDGYLVPFGGSYAHPVWRLVGMELSHLQLPALPLLGKPDVDGQGRPWLWLLDDEGHDESALLVGQPPPSLPHWRVARRVRMEGFRPLGARFAFRDEEVWVLLSDSGDYRRSRHMILYSRDGWEWEVRFGPEWLRVLD